MAKYRFKKGGDKPKEQAAAETKAKDQAPGKKNAKAEKRYGPKTVGRA